MGEIDLNVDGICYEIGGPENDRRMCMFEKGHDGQHGWEVDPELSVLANEIAIETGCPDEVALATARYAHQQITGWKTAAENAWATAEVARSLATQLHEAATAVVEVYDNPDEDMDRTGAYEAVGEAIEALRAIITE